MHWDSSACVDGAWGIKIPLEFLITRLTEQAQWKEICSGMIFIIPIPFCVLSFLPLQRRTCGHESTVEFPRQAIQCDSQISWQIDWWRWIHTIGGLSPSYCSMYVQLSSTWGIPGQRWRFGPNPVSSVCHGRRARTNQDATIRDPVRMRSITGKNMVGEGSHYSLSGWSITTITRSPSMSLLIFRSLDDSHPFRHD